MPLTIVITFGVWDLFHVGHLRMLQRARALGDKLVVGVPCEAVVAEDKGHPPIIPLTDRVEILQALKCVDVVIPYYHLEFLTCLNMLDPDILVIGEFWGKQQRHTDAETWMQERDKRVVVLPYTTKESTTKIKERVCYEQVSR